ENLGDGAARVVGDQVDLIEVEALAELDQQVSKCPDRHPLVRSRRALSVDWQVNSYAAPPVGQSGDQGGPQVRTGGDPVHKQSRRSDADVDVAEVGGRSADVMTMVVKAR